MIGRAEIGPARERIAPYLRRTPVFETDGASLGLSCPVTLKLEQLQHTGSFKPRGAFNSLLTRTIPDAGVVAVSGGNHGAAVAYAASVLGVPARVFVPEYAEPTKIARIRGFGAEVVVVGDQFSATVAAAREHGGHTGAVLVHPYDDRETVVGQGTLGAELEEQMPDLDVLVVAVGGGGLIGGISAWYGTRIRIVAVESAGTPTLATAWDDGPEATTEVSGIAASSLGAPSIGSICYGMVRERIERPILVSDAEILDAQRRLWAAARLIGEPGGVAALAALTSRRFTPQPGERVGVLVCGGNADPNWFKV